MRMTVADIQQGDKKKADTIKAVQDSSHEKDTNIFENPRTGKPFPKQVIILKLICIIIECPCICESDFPSALQLSSVNSVYNAYGTRCNVTGIYWFDV